MGTKGVRNKLLSREATLRANGLLDMLYKPSELADELGIPPRVVYDKLVPAGVPHTKDTKGNIWLHGPIVAEWVRGLTRKKIKLADDHAYCLACRMPVEMVGDRKVVDNGRMPLIHAECGTCGGSVFRGSSRDQS